MSETRTLPRSFGFNFRNILFNGTLLQGPNGNDVYVQYNSAEYPSLQEFFTSIQPSKEEQDSILEKINSLIKSP